VAPTKLHILDNGAMHCDLTWLLLKPGRNIRPRQEKDHPIEWYDASTYTVLVETPEGRLLWDTSCPRDWEERWEPTGLQDFFPYDNVTEEQYLDARLKQLGVEIGNIDYVVLSHLHFDHAGNANMFAGHGPKMICNDKEKKFAFGFEGLFTGAHLKTDYEDVDWETVSGDTEILPGVTLIETPGHTPGQMSMKVDLPDSGTMMFTSDAVYMGDSYGPPAVPAAIVNDLNAFYESVEKVRSIGAVRRPGDLRPRLRADEELACRARRQLHLSFPLHHAAQLSTEVFVTNEEVFTYGAPNLKFGPGASDEIGFDLHNNYGSKRVLVVTDRRIAGTGTPQKVADQMAKYDVEAHVFDGVHVEPTDVSLQEAVDWARENGPWDAFVAVGGGSSIDTAKAINLMTTNPGELMDYINAPVGGGQNPSKPLNPLIAVPTTTGTGAESTTICVLDVLSLRVKTGISHARLRPTMAVVDPLLTLTQPAGVTAAAGMDILCHALESYTAKPYTSYERKQPDQRVPYCGANPVADMWSEKALRLLSKSFRTSVKQGDNHEARMDMAMAATFAGMGFGNAGVHIPHANAYPIAGQVKDFHPDGYPADEPMVPHGMSVSLTAPEAFRFTFEANPDRHLYIADLLAPNLGNEHKPEDRLPAALMDLMRDIGIPNGIGGVGYDENDISELVDGTMKQQRLLATAPKEVTEDDAAGIFNRSLELW